MPYCNIEGCEHKIKHNPSGKKSYSSWKLFGICPCCAAEIFPHGFFPPRGITIRFTPSSNCLALIQLEELQLDTIERRQNAKEEMQQV